MRGLSGLVHLWEQIQMLYGCKCTCAIKHGPCTVMTCCIRGMWCTCVWHALCGDLELELEALVHTSVNVNETLTDPSRTLTSQTDQIARLSGDLPYHWFTYMQIWNCGFCLPATLHVLVAGFMWRLHMEANGHFLPCCRHNSACTCGCKVEQGHVQKGKMNCSCWRKPGGYN